MSFTKLFTKKESTTKDSIKVAFGVLLVGSILALAASFVLSFEEIRLLQNPDTVLSCNFNVVFNCATVMQTWQASVFFGVPNMFIGLMAFPVFITLAVAALWSGAQYKRWFLLAMNAGALLSALFAYWLFFSSVYVIQVLCPWCLVVTFSTTLMLAAVSYITLRQNLKGFTAKTNKKIQKFLDNGYYQLIVVSWYILLAVLVFLKFGSDLFI